MPEPALRYFRFGARPQELVQVRSDARRNVVNILRPGGQLRGGCQSATGCQGATYRIDATPGCQLISHPSCAAPARDPRRDSPVVPDSRPGMQKPGILHREIAPRRLSVEVRGLPGWRLGVGGQPVDPFQNLTFDGLCQLTAPGGIGLRSIHHRIYHFSHEPTSRRYGARNQTKRCCVLICSKFTARESVG
jgi:hypothetical protein